MKVEVAVLGSPSLVVLMVSVDLKQHLKKTSSQSSGAVCESRGGRPELTVPNSPNGFCELDATFEKDVKSELRSCVKVEVAVLGFPSLIVLWSLWT